jgi:phosphoribosylamine-glycine ligase
VGKEYPERSSQGQIIEIADLPENTIVFHAGTKVVEEKLFTNGGRVLNVVSYMNSMDEAVHQAYKAMEAVKFSGLSFRTDIARRACAPCR